ncbi:MAG TPA: class I SAM-dependent methyltransferase [Propionicimonas sp.]|nr:class I SAM-dependent methyltransferase [Propionicimonas sp.]HRA07581.1 class I SAM-dependent methyltransferase [Propionicimonas sp.]
MDPELARWLVSDAARPALAEASGQPDPGSLAAATALRRHWTAEQSAAVLTQVALRRRGLTKFGPPAEHLFFTPDALEQATRAEVAAWRAARFVAAGVREVVDLGCGIGADALAFAAAGLKVVAVEADPATAVLAAANLGAANLGAGAEVVCGDAVELAGELLSDGAAVFIDPARRTASGRTWRVEDFSPPWDFATSLLTGRFGCIKGAPGLPSALLPNGLDATWVSHRGDLVETSLWSSRDRSSTVSPVPEPPRRQAVLLPGNQTLASGKDAPSGQVSRWLYEPDPAVIRARAIGTLADSLHAWTVHPGIAYLTGDALVATPFATAFEVSEILPYSEQVIRAWVRDHAVGVLEIKVRGLDVDPSTLRKRLKPRGPNSVTLVLTPTLDGSRALVVRRVRTGSGADPH